MPSGPRRPTGPACLALLVMMALAGAAATITPAAARDLTAVERGDLGRTVSRFDTAMRRQDIPAIIDVIPPRVIAHIAAQAGVDLAQLRRVVIEQTREIMKSSVLRDFRMDLAGARYGATPGGAPYALIPMSTTIRMAGRDAEVRSNALAMIDGGRWYLLDLNQPSRVAIFTQVYPDFAGLPLGGPAL